MTVLAQVVWDCPAIRGMDKLVLMGWAEQVEDGMDVAYCSKTTVADFLGVSLDSIKRRTHALVAGGWMVDTGGRKQWEPDCWTPVYRINLEPSWSWISGVQIALAVQKKRGCKLHHKVLVLGLGLRLSLRLPLHLLLPTFGRSEEVRPIQKR